jgi:Bacterial protein of unknown function (DUF894).
LYSIKHPRVRTILLLFLAVGVFGWSYAVLMPAFARDVLGRGANGYGILMSASGVGALSVPCWSRRLDIFSRRAKSHSAASGYFPRCWRFRSPKVFRLRSYFFCRRIWNAAVFFTSNTVLQTIVPDEMRGRVMGVWSLVFGAMIPLGSLEAGAVAHFG